MDVAKLFGKKSREIIATVDGVKTIHTIRSPANKESLEYRRKVAQVKIKNKEVHQTEVSMMANAWYYDLLCTGVVAINGEGPQEVPDYKEIVDEDVKFAVIQAFTNRVQ